MAVDPRWRENQQVAQAASGSANELIPALRRVIESGAWREFEHPMHGLTRYERFTDYCREFLGLEPGAVKALAATSNSVVSANIVRQLLEDIEPARPQGRPEGTTSKGGNTPFPHKRDAAEVLARLKRDDPALAAQVIAGDLTPHAAALKAGIRKPRATFRTDDVQRAVAVLLKHYTRDQLLEALA